MSDPNDTPAAAASGAPASDAPAPDAPAPQADVNSRDAGERTAPPRGARAAAVVRWLIVAAMAAAAGAAIAYTSGWLEPGDKAEAAAQYICPMHPSVVQDQAGDCPICSMSLVLKPSARGAQPGSVGDGTYHCPMHPEVVSDDPEATCDKCGGMRLQPKPATIDPAQPSTAAAPAASDVPGLVAVDLTPERIQLAGLRTAQVTRASLAAELRATGTVTASERGLAQVQTRVAGWIEQLHVEETGQRIKKGQLLARIYSPEWLTAQQEFLTALRWNGAAPANATDTGVTEGVAPAPRLGLADGARRRLELLGVVSAEIDEIARGGVPLRALGVRSPVAGHVTRKNVVQGQYVQPGTPLFDVADLSKVWVLADVPEHDLGRVVVGARARVELNAFSERRVEGRVDFVYPTVAADTRSVRLRIELDNADLALKPGMYGDVYIEAKAIDALIVPSEAVVDTGTVQYVFLARAGGRFEPHRVRVGATEGDHVQLLAGVAEGDTVVTTANFLVDSESRLQAAISGGAPDALEQAPPASDAPAPTEPRARPGAPAAHVPPPPKPTTAPSVPTAPAAPAAPMPAAPTPAAPAPPAMPAPSASVASPPARPASACDREFDRARYPDKYRQCLACEVQHRSMGPTMVDDCKRAIARPWR